MRKQVTCPHCKKRVEYRRMYLEANGDELSNKIYKEAEQILKNNDLDSPEFPKKIKALRELDEILGRPAMFDREITTLSLRMHRAKEEAHRKKVHEEKGIPYEPREYTYE